MFSTLFFIYFLCYCLRESVQTFQDISSLVTSTGLTITHLSEQNFSWPVILTGQGYGFQINNWKNIFIHINHENYKHSLNRKIF